MNLRPAARIYLVVYGGLIVLSTYLIGHHYYVQLQQAEKSTLERLYGISSTLAQQVDQGAIEEVFKKYPFKGDTAGLRADPTYLMYTNLFARAVESNHLKTPIYTLSYDSAASCYFGGVASNGSETYGWHYVSPPKELDDVYHQGGTISRFEDDHGTWLSAVCPLKNENGEVFAVIEADYPFNSFIKEARSELLGGLLVSVLVFIAIGAITYPVLNQILSAEEKSKLALAEASKVISNKNEEVVSSLEYASTIQETMLPDHEELSAFFANHIIFNRPRDIVSGDFYWFHQLDESTALIAVADCTGHGVPGALMSIMGHSYLNEIVIEQKITSPAEILERLNAKIEETFAQKSDGKKNGTDGMDVGLCLVDRVSKKVVFAGARRPLTIIHQGNSKQIQGTRRGIGEHYLTSDTPFQNCEVELISGATYYLCSDGLQDQFGGARRKKLMRKKVIEWLVEMEGLEPDLRKDWIETRFAEWKGENAQIDDICVVGFSA